MLIPAALLLTFAALQVPESAVITGEVRGPQGQPLCGVQVVAVGPAFTPVGAPSLTDDRGIYRIFALPPGRYTVAALPSGEEAADVFLPVWFPSGTDAGQAEFLELKAGDTARAVNLAVVAGAAANIMGRVEPAQRVALALSLRAGLRSPLAVTFSQPDGTFLIAGVPAGEFTLTALSAEASAAQPVNVNGADVSVRLALNPLAAAKGSVAGCTAAEVRLEALEVWPTPVQITAPVAAGAFSAEALPAGRYRATARGCAGHADVVVGASVPLKITLTEPPQ